MKGESYEIGEDAEEVTPFVNLFNYYGAGERGEECMCVRRARRSHPGQVEIEKAEC